MGQRYAMPTQLRYSSFHIIHVFSKEHVVVGVVNRFIWVIESVLVGLVSAIHVVLSRANGTVVGSLVDEHQGMVLGFNFPVAFADPDQPGRVAV